MAAMVESGLAFTGTEKCAACCVYLASGAADALTGRYVSATEDYVALTDRAEDVQAQDLQMLRLTSAPNA